MSWGRKKSGSARLSSAELLGVALALAGPGCKQEELPAPASAVPAPPPTGATPGPVPAHPAAGAPGGMPAPGAATAAAMPPAFGFFCATDNDAQCPFGRCVAGRCGGCSSLAECKPGSQCLPTLVGQLCLPGTTTQPQPAATPTASPAPAATPPAATPAATATAQSPLERARQLCVQRTNEYRARVGVAPVTRRSDAEACGDAQARADSISRTAHGAFGQCRERAQNECPGWPGAVEEVIDRCLAMMFAEGPGSGPEHGHYVNMTDPRYRGVSCGISQAARGELWIVQDFYP
jgi:Cysteine-rich secretory protein family